MPIRPLDTAVQQIDPGERILTLTENQNRAITEPGNLLVVAAAGAGKTGTLVRRCTRLLLDPAQPVGIRELLVVTFTEAAAAEVRRRIRETLEQEALARPEDEQLRDQLAKIDSAYITTLHSFCLEIVRKHTLELGIDPAVSVLEPQQVRVLFSSTLDQLLQEHYGADDPFSAELRELIRTHFNGWDQGLREFVERVHHFTQTRNDPGQWFAETLSSLSRERSSEWHAWYNGFMKEWCAWWLPYLKDLPAENINAAACVAILENACAKSDLLVPKLIKERDDEAFWNRRKGKDEPALRAFFKEAEFLASLLPEGANIHPLDQDWEWMRVPLLTMVRFAEEFSNRFAEAKLERGVVDFHDLEQFVLSLLYRKETAGIAADWKQKFRAIFVDEYQDINAAQDLILAALSSEVPVGNRFLVGDMKQSIYRFRQADPDIFRRYLERPGWITIPLSENFRSHEGILRFVNPIFRWLMQRDLGGIDYDATATLQFGGGESRADMASASSEKPPVEIHLFITDPATDGSDGDRSESEGDDESADLEAADIEARLVAARFRALKDSGFSIWDEKHKARRSVEWRDMVVLLRAGKGKLETYAKAFAAAGVPLQTKRNAFFTTQEVLDLLNVLNILDNPLQDIPVVAVLRSPMVGLTANELAAIRVESNEKHFWRAARDYARGFPNSPASAKLAGFLQLVEKWRDPRRCASLSQRLEAILVDTGYGDWLLAQLRGRERYANVRQLLRIAREFDETRGQSLYLFLRHVEELQNAAGDLEPTGCAEENAVRLMTVHQSKGLEFPVVAVADMGKRFNFSDLTRTVAIHDRYGLCSMIKPPHTGQRYPSLPLWLARRSDKSETIGEEMRVLYVALTRAQNHLLLFGKVSRRTTETWKERAQRKAVPAQICRHQSWLDWLGSFVTKIDSEWTAAAAGTTDFFSYFIHLEKPVLEEPPGRSAPAPAEIEVFHYPHEKATREPAKTSVTALRKRAEQDDEAARLVVRFRGQKGGTERGRATHAFLELFALGTTPLELTLRAEAGRLAGRGDLRAEEIGNIDFEGISAFWGSDIGTELLRNPEEIRRELPFTFKASRADLSAAGLGANLQVPDEEFVVIQGIADLVLLRASEIWLIDFKTDHLLKGEIKEAAERYRPQIILYALALGAIYNRPVTKKGIFFLEPRRFAWL